MLRQGGFKQKTNAAMINDDHLGRLIMMFSFALLLIMCISPEVSFAGSLEAQLEKVGTLTNSKVKTIGFSAATILGGIGAALRGNIKIAGLIVAVGIGISLYLEWIAGGMVLTVAAP